jgi:hypothetical protein
MTSTPDLNIDGSPIYESLVATTGDPYQPPAYQLPDVYGAGRDNQGGAALAAYGGAQGWDAGAVAGMGMPMAGAGTPAMLSQLLGRMLGDGQSWCAIMIFGGPVVDQLRQYQQMQHMQSQGGPQGYPQQPYMQPPGMPSPFMPTPTPPSPPVPQYAAPAAQASGSLPGYDDPQGTMAQAYQQAYQWAAQQQAMLAASLGGQAQPLALTSGPDTAGLPQYFAPPELPPAEETQTYGGMLNQDWSGWLGQSAAERGPEPQEVDLDDEYDRRGGRIGGRFGAAMRELRGR